MHYTRFHTVTTVPVTPTKAPMAMKRYARAVRARGLAKHAGTWALITCGCDSTNAAGRIMMFTQDVVLGHSSTHDPHTRTDTHWQVNEHIVGPCPQSTATKLQHGANGLVRWDRGGGRGGGGWRRGGA